MEKFIKIAYRNLFRNKRRTLLCILSVAVAVFVITLMISFMEGILYSARETVYTFETGHIMITNKEFEKQKDFYPLQFPIEQNNKSLEQYIDEIKQVDGIVTVRPRIKTIATLTDNRVKHAVIWGINYEEERQNRYFNLAEKSDGIIEGRYPANGKNECIIGSRLAAKMHINVGDRIPMKIISSIYSDSFYKPKVVGIFNFDYANVDENFIIIPLDRLQKIGKMKDKTQSLYIYINDAALAGEIADKVAQHINSETEMVKNWQKNEVIAMLTQSKSIYALVYIIFLIAASFLIINTLLMIIFERIKEIGVMGALGMKRREVVGIFFLESLFMSAIGALIGVIIGGILTLLGSIYPISYETMTGGADVPVSNIVFLRFSFTYLFQSFAFGMIVSTICTVLPSLRAAFISPIDALRR